MCTVDLITGKGPEPATVGVKVHLLWRDKLEYPFTQGITFNSECTAISGRCIATRIEGGWHCVDSGDQDGKGADKWIVMDNDDSECLRNTFAADKSMWYTPGANAPTSPHIAAAARPKKKQRTGAASLQGIYR